MTPVMLPPRLFDWLPVCNRVRVPVWDRVGLHVWLRVGAPVWLRVKETTR